MKIKLLTFILILLSHSSLAWSENIIKIIDIHNRPAYELPPVIQPLLQPSDRIMVSGNKLIVRTSAERLEELLKLIETLDQPLNNLLISVIQSRQTTAQELNARANAQVKIPLHSPDRLNAKIHGHFYQTQGRNKQESTQTLRTLEGHAAHIKTGKIHPIDNISIYDSGFGRPAISKTTDFIEASTGVAVTPYLSGLFVTLHVSPWSDQMQLSGNIQTQSAKTVIRAKLGEWVEIGGANENNQQTGKGLLSYQHQTNKNQLHILVKVDKIN